MEPVLYDSRSEFCKKPFGAVKTDEVISFSVYLPVAYQLHSPRMLLYKADLWDSPIQIDMQFMESSGIWARYTCEFSSSDPLLYFYLFEVQDPQDRTMRIFRGQNNFGVLAQAGDSMWQLTIYDKNFKTPEFLKKGVMYQIFPDRFASSGTPKENVPADRRMHKNWYEIPDFRPDANGQYRNDDYFGGDLLGIMQKLPYLKELGVGTIYLNPVFEAHSNHRYNTATFERIDPLLGSEDDLKELCKKAAELGISIILDGVFNHVGSDSVYFNKERRYGDSGAYNDPQSPYRNWFDFVNYPHEYRSWWGFDTLPNLNEENEEYARYICGEHGILTKWMRAGISGWRLDVADELPDSFLDRLNECVKTENPQAAIIGEVWEDASNKISYGHRRRYLLGKQLDSVMNYPFKDAILQYVRDGKAAELYQTIMGILENYPHPVIEVLMTSLSTHDVERAMTALAGEPVWNHDREWQARNNLLNTEQYELGKKLLRCAAVIQYMLPGIPCLYYGDEAGAYGYKDPFNRACYPWGHEDGDLLALFRALGEIRTRFPALASADFCAVSFEQKAVVFVRGDEASDRFCVAVNRSPTPVRVTIPLNFSGADLLFGEIKDGTLPPYGCAILHINRKG